MSSAAPKTVQRTPFKRWCDENTGLFFLIPWILGFLIFCDQLHRLLSHFLEMYK